MDCYPSQPSDEEIKVYENFRMPYKHQTYRLTSQEKQYGKLNWQDIDSADLQWWKLASMPLEDSLIFKLEKDYGIISIHKVRLNYLSH